MFTVRWTRRAKRDLADIWLQSSDRLAVTQASNTVDLLLSRSPLQLGESREGNRRILIEPPLAVFYEVILDDYKVKVRFLRDMKRTL